ncbi:MAG: hypothetical protein KF878_00555 [Planctomycetes bacterium]|nr:hypothetical protein [Planctomycetota bacterium]
MTPAACCQRLLLLAALAWTAQGCGAATREEAADTAARRALDAATLQRWPKARLEVDRAHRLGHEDAPTLRRLIDEAEHLANLPEWARGPTSWTPEDVNLPYEPSPQEVVVHKRSSRQPHWRLHPALTAGPPGAPPFLQGYVEALETRRTTLNFVDVPLDEVVSFLQDITGLNLVLEPGAAGRQLTLRVRDVPLHDALVLVAEEADLLVGFDPTGQALLLTPLP